MFASRRTRTPGVRLVGTNGRADSDSPVVKPEAELLSVGVRDLVALVVVDSTLSGRREAGLEEVELVTTGVLERAVRDIIPDHANLPVPVSNDGVTAEVGGREKGDELGEFRVLLVHDDPFRVELF